MRVLPTRPSESRGSGKKHLIRNTTDNEWPGIHSKKYIKGHFVIVGTSQNILPTNLYMVQPPVRRVYGTPSLYVWSVADQNTVMRHMTVLSFPTGHESPFPSERHGVARGPGPGDTATGAEPRKCSLSWWPGASLPPPGGTR